MTFTFVSSSDAPQVAKCLEDVVYSHKVVESNLALIEMYMNHLQKEKISLLERKTSLVHQIQHMHSRTSSLARLPIACVAEYLSLSDMGALSRTSCLLREMCFPDKKFMLVHLTSPKASLSLSEAQILLSGVCLPLVRSLVIDAKRASGKNFLKALVPQASTLTSLQTLRVSAFAETGEFLVDLFAFMSALPSHQLRSVHFSGLRSIAHVGTLLSSQRLSIERFKVDYFVNGHEREILPEYIPVMPKLRAFVYDVADVSELAVELLASRLAAIENKSLVETIYLPHAEIIGDRLSVFELIQLVKTEFKSVAQLVVRFRRLPLSVREIVSLRESFSSLPAVCISDHFVVCQSTWCPWWPALKEVWKQADEITGLSVFREQIDFESLGTSATLEWENLSTEQQNLWSTQIAPKIHQLYLH